MLLFFHSYSLSESWFWFVFFSPLEIILVTMHIFNRLFYHKQWHFSVIFFFLLLLPPSVHLKWKTRTMNSEHSLKKTWRQIWCTLQSLFFFLFHFFSLYHSSVFYCCCFFFCFLQCLYHPFLYKILTKTRCHCYYFMRVKKKFEKKPKMRSSSKKTTEVNKN